MTFVDDYTFLALDHKVVPRVFSGGVQLWFLTCTQMSTNLLQRENDFR